MKVFMKTRTTQYLMEGHLQDSKAGKRKDFILKGMPNLKLNLLKANKE